MARGPGPSPTNVPSVTAKMPGCISFWMLRRSTSVSWMTECVQWRFAVQESAEGVLHCAGDGGEDMRLHRWQVDDVLAEEHLRDLEALRVDVVEGDHPGLGLEVHPLGGRKVEEDAIEAVLLFHGLVLILQRAFDGVDYDGAVVRGDKVGVAVFLERVNRRRRAATGWWSTPGSSAATRC